MNSRLSLRILWAAVFLFLVARSTPCVAGAEPGPAQVRWNLDNVVAIALSNHPLIRGAEAETAASAARKGQAMSPYYPQIGLSTGISRTRAYSSTAKSNSTTDTAFAQGNLSLLITDFGKTGATVDRADAQLSSSREAGRSVRGDVAFNAKVAYFNVLRAKRLLDVIRETLKQRESLLRQAQAYYDAGIRARIDVARAEANLYQARAELTFTENALRIARITLLNRMGIDGPREFSLEDTLATESVDWTLENLVREAEANRPELRSLLEKQRAAEFNVRAARGGYYPVLTGNAGYGYAGEHSPDEQNYNLSVLLSVPVFSGFQTRQQVAEAEAQHSSARYAVIDLQRLVRLEVEEAALSVRASGERSEARKKEREASGENLRLATGRYEVGAGDIIEMIDAQVQMTLSDAAMIETMYDYSVSVASLMRAVGR
jgi:outer membrane protein TolC